MPKYVRKYITKEEKKHLFDFSPFNNNKMPVGMKKDGTLKKGYKYKKGGGVVEAKAATAKKKAAPKKKAASKKKVVNKGSLKASLISAGVRLPHGYKVVKRTPRKKAAPKNKSATKERK